MCLSWRLAWFVYLLLILVHQGKAGGWSDGLDDICNASEDVTDCLKREAIKDIDAISDADFIELADGVTLERIDKVESSARSSGVDISWIPGINSTIGRKLDSLFTGRRFDVSLSNRLLTKKRKDWKYWMNRYHMYEYQDMVTRINDIKEKKMLWYLLMAISAMAAIAGPVAMNALGAIAAKALIISKVAVIIAGVVALKKLFANDNEGETKIKIMQDDPIKTRRVSYSRPAGLPDPYRFYYNQHKNQQGV